jgi:glycosyltransferase involved in cell wall biosynthesis
MRILHVEQYFKTREMVGGCRAFEMARRLVARGHRVDFVTTRMEAGTDRDWQISEAAGIRIHSVPVPYSNRMSYRQRLVSFIHFARAASSYGRGLAADMVFASSTPLTVAIPAVRLKKSLNIPMVFEVRDLWPEIPIALGALRNPLARAAARWLERCAYRNAARIVALSPGMKAGICRTGYPAERVSVIPNSCDVDLFRVPQETGLAWRRQHPEVGDRPMILYAGTLGRVNGVGWLARLADRIRMLDSEICFVLVGDGTEREQILAQAAQYGVLGVNFFMYPPVKKSEMSALFSAAWLTTSVVIDVPELRHNSANKVFDSFAAGRPVVINHEGWLAELLEETGAGLVLPVSDLATSARLLWQRLRDTNWRQRASAAASRLAEERFSRDRLAEQLEVVLKAAVRYP